ncbi:NUDIX hydrolase [Salicibibacter cibi]|uniref:NUDIX hydrolase n=1 Tax=Salicibibacter cibi TaxID=2743001 RepID=A0A7T6ZA92_9BACI|nr:NUDIX hydrolase [Salicibibacter cibi]QQK79801.1 NUDIX hydrolase [Salicibibacter cibi]
MSVHDEPTLNKETIYEGKIIDVELHEVKLPNGKTSMRELVKHPGAVAVIGITDEEKIPLVRQFRKATEEMLLEIPAGKREKGEEPKTTAERELQEETGYKAAHMHEIAQFYTSPGFADELVSVYLAVGLQAGMPRTEADEFLSVEEWTLNDAGAALREGRLRDAKTAFAIQALLLR